MYSAPSRVRWLFVMIIRLLVTLSAARVSKAIGQIGLVVLILGCTTSA